jgi:hypothetical protein
VVSIDLAGASSVAYRAFTAVVGLEIVVWGEWSSLWALHVPLVVLGPVVLSLFIEVVRMFRGALARRICELSHSAAYRDTEALDTLARLVRTAKQKLKLHLTTS